MKAERSQFQAPLNPSIGFVIEGLATWVAQLVLPISFGLIALRLIVRCEGWGTRSIALVGAVENALLAPLR